MRSKNTGEPPTLSLLSIIVNIAIRMTVMTQQEGSFSQSGPIVNAILRCVKTDIRDLGSLWMVNGSESEGMLDEDDMMCLTPKQETGREGPISPL